MIWLKGNGIKGLNLVFYVAKHRDEQVTPDVWSCYLLRLLHTRDTVLPSQTPSKEFRSKQNWLLIADSCDFSDLGHLCLIRITEEAQHPTKTQQPHLPHIWFFFCFYLAPFSTNRSFPLVPIQENVNSMIFRISEMFDWIYHIIASGLKQISNIKNKHSSDDSYLSS